MKKLLAIVISMAMLVAMMPMGVFATGEKGITLPAVSEDGVIKLTQNIEISDAEVLDLTDKTITTDGYNFVIKEGGSLIVKGQGTVKSEKVATKKDEIFKTFMVEKGGSLIINGGNFTTETAQFIVSRGTVNVTGGNFSAEYNKENNYTDSNCAFVITGEGSRLDMTGGTINAGEGANDCGLYGIYASKGAVVNLGGAETEGPTVTSYCAPLGCNHDTATGTYNVYSGTYESTWTGGNINYNYFHGAIYAACKGAVKIEGGTFKGEYGVAIPYDNVGLKLTISGGDFTKLTKDTINESHKNVSGDNETNTTLITGGKFSGDVSAYVADGYVLIGNTVVKNTIPTGAVASIDEQYFKTLAGAIAAASDRATVKLIKDIKEDITVPAGKSITIDLNSKSITNSSSDTITVAQGANLTIKGTGTVDNITHGKAALVNYGTAVLDGGTYTRSLEDEENNKDSAGKNSFYTILNDKGGNMTIKNGVNVTNKGHFSSMIRNGGDSASQSASKLKINGGSFSGGINTVKNDELGELTVSGGSFSNTSQFVIMNWHKANISGGSFEANDSAEAVLFTSKYLENRAVGELTVTGGTYISKDNQKVLCDRYDNSEKYKGTATITGGTFSSDPSAYVASGYYADKSGDAWTVRPVPYTPSTPTDNVTNNTTDKSTTADLAPAVKDNKAETTVDAKTADKIVDKAVENKSTEVIVDATGNNTVASSEVAIPEKTVKEISEKTDANLVIKTDNGKVDFDKTALAAVAAQAGTTGTVRLVVETVKTDENICHVELKLITSNGAVKDFNGGNVKVTINLTKELAAKELVCVYIDDNGIYTLVEGVLNANGTYTFTTGHFSEYAVMAKAEADKKIAEQLNTMIKDVNLKVRTSKTAKKNIKAVVSGDVKALTDAGYTVKYKFYRSEKKTSKYEAKATKAGKTYINTAGKKGTKYYYKAKAMVYSGDTLVGQTVLTQCKYGVRTWSK